MNRAWLAAVPVVMALSGCVTQTSGDNAMSQCPATVRVATFNVSMEAGNYVDEVGKDLSHRGANILEQQLARGEHPQIRAVAEIIQRVRPDILLLNEFDYIEPAQAGIERFVEQFLARPQSGQLPIDYPHYYVGPVNTGVLMPVDVDGDGEISAPNDTYGFGHYPGHYGMAVLSRFPIDREAVRTFQKFLWRDMPGALLPQMPSGDSWYPEPVLKHFRLSSKSHWDIPIRIGNQRLHLLASHPTPPVFDGPEDRNGRRNHDEIRLWRDYIDNKADYLYDDKGVKGGLSERAAFVIAGDLNASPVEGSARPEAIRALLAHPRVTPASPESAGARQAMPDNPHAASHTVEWGLQVDYVLPSRGLSVADTGVFWPVREDPLHRLVENRRASSDHRLVWADVCTEVKRD